MRTSTIIATLSAPPETVWDVVTNLQDTEWRSDLSRVEVSLDGRHFTEFSANGHSTSFSILEKTPYERYAFSMRSNIFSGEWEGLFSKTPTGGTHIIFTETLQMRNFCWQILSYLLLPLKKKQKAYVRDLERKLKTII